MLIKLCRTPSWLDARTRGLPRRYRALPNALSLQFFLSRFLRCLSPLGVEAYVPTCILRAGSKHSTAFLLFLSGWPLSQLCACISSLYEGHPIGRASVISPSLLDGLGASKENCGGKRGGHRMSAECEPHHHYPVKRELGTASALS
jgi:hypothetical protein